jgi:hypothetical protein
LAARAVLRVYGGYGAAAAIQIAGGARWSLVVIALLVISLCAYLPLRAYSQGLDNRAGDKLLSSGRNLDDYEKDLVRHSLDRTHWLLGAVFVGWILYQMLAAQYGWWQPKTPEEWGLVLFGAAWIVLTLPTVLITWLEKGEYDLPYPSWEDDR